MINLAPGDAPAVAGTVDIMLYYTYYQDDPDPLVAFNYQKATDMIDAAKAEGLQIGVQCPVLTQGMSYDDITPQYLADWSARIGPFIDAILAYDTDNTVAWWYGPEETRWWRPLQDYGIAMALSAELAARDSRNLPHMTYDAAHYTAPALLPGLLRAAGDSPDSVAYTAALPPNSVHPTQVYPTTFNIDRTATEQLIPIRAGIIRGSYMAHLLGEYAHTNRIWSIQLIDSAWEAIALSKQIVATNNANTGLTDTLDYSLVLHAPDLTSGGSPEISAAEARHDFWSGLHRGTGVYIYNYAYAGAAPIAWGEYEMGMQFIKNELRPFFAGERAYPLSLEVPADSPMPVIPGDDYEVNGGFTGSYLQLPDYPAVNASYLRVSHETYLIVTNSYNQRIQFTVDVDREIRLVELKIGDPGLSEMTFCGSRLTDTFQGIDAKVYKVLT